jgi:hypothetical protein
MVEEHDDEATRFSAATGDDEGAFAVTPPGPGTSGATGSTDEAT